MKAYCLLSNQAWRIDVQICLLQLTVIYYFINPTLVGILVWEDNRYWGKPITPACRSPALQSLRVSAEYKNDHSFLPKSLRFSALPIRNYSFRFRGLQGLRYTGHGIYEFTTESDLITALNKQAEHWLPELALRTGSQNSFYRACYRVEYKGITFEQDGGVRKRHFYVSSQISI